MFPHHICENIDILAVMTVRKNNFGFHGNRKTQGHKHQLNNLYFKYQVCQMKLRHLNTFLQFRLLFHEPHCTIFEIKMFPPMNPVHLLIKYHTSVKCKSINIQCRLPLTEFWPPYAGEAIHSASGVTLEEITFKTFCTIRYFSLSYL